MNSDIELIIACSKTEPTASDINQIRTYIRQSTQQQLFKTFSLTHFHGVFPLVCKTLQTHASDLCSEQSLTELSRQKRTLVMRNIHMTAELQNIINLFKNQGIATLVFKGPALAQIAYGDFTLRQYSDLDIFISRADFKKATPILTELNYHPRYPIDRYRHDKVLFEMNNDCPFYNHDTGLAIELHWDFFRKLAIPTTQFEPWQATETVSINDCELTTLSHENHILYLCLHGSKHIWERLMWIADIDRFIRAVPSLDWNQILLKSANMGTQKMFLFGVALAINYYQTPVPEQITRLCQQHRFQTLINFVASEYAKDSPTPEDSLVKLGKVISLRDNAAFKTKTLLEFLFRPGINERRTIVLPDSMFGLYWLIRPLAMTARFIFCKLLNLGGQKTR